RLALWNPSPPGGSLRKATLAGLPVIEHSHFVEYLQLAALRMFGWERARAAKRWVEHTSRQFTSESWERVMTQLEQMDATPELSGITAPTLVIAEPAPGANEEARRYRQKIVSSLANAELATIKSSAATTYAELAARFFSAGDAQREVGAAGTAIILFADIADSTALTERMGDAAFREKARALDDALRSVVRDNGGAAIDGKLLGDGILATFPAASQAIAAALTLEAAAAPTGLGLHIGLHAGDVLREADNVFGGAVNIAARISALAPPGEVFVSRTVADLARTSAGVTFEDRGEHALKGIAEPQRVFAVRKDGG
ncbi:MAG TPA: adenylate/guanylate cyclase domain-containing protein, partial [Dehalococcoidia bacterium]